MTIIQYVVFKKYEGHKKTETTHRAISVRWGDHQKLPARFELATSSLPWMRAACCAKGA